MPSSWLPVLRYQAPEVDVMIISMQWVLQSRQHVVMSGWLWIASPLQAEHCCHARGKLNAQRGPACIMTLQSQQTTPREPPVICIFPVTQAYTTFCENYCVLTVAVM